MEQDFAVLIADDNELNRWLLCEQLRHWTMDVSIAKDGREAWHLLQNQRYALIFLDMNMPFLNGLDLIEKIRTEDNPNQAVPVVSITAHVQSQQHQAFIAAGFNDCLIKPILLQHLKPLMEQCRHHATADSEYYARQLIAKTDFNYDMGLQFLNRLFDEIPVQLSGIEASLKESNYQQAWQIAHKLHGSFSFYGFADFLPLANAMEQCLLEKNSVGAELQLTAITDKFYSLSSNKAAILATIAKEIDRGK